MKKPIESIVLEVKEDELNIVLDDAIKIINDEYAEFRLGDFIVFAYKINKEEKIKEIEEMMEKAKRELEELKRSPWNEEEAILHVEEYIEYLQEKKEKIENAEYAETIKIEYYIDPTYINITYNDKTIKIEEAQRKEILLENIKIIIEKYEEDYEYEED